jgi:multiple sugar transport system permease protein
MAEVTAVAGSGVPVQAGVAQRRRRRIGDGLAGYMFLAPWLAGFFLLTLGPTLASLYLSFTRYDLLNDPVWVGMRNYERMMTADPRFWNSVGVTLTYVLWAVPLKLVFALLLAMALDKGIRGLTVYRAIFFLPSLLGGSVAIAVLWRQIFGADGLINRVLGLFGVTGASWISDPDTALGTLIVLGVWQFGSPMIVFLAGLRQIPTDMYEAAQMDGAKRFRVFFRITLPLLTPVIFFNLVLQTINAFKAFTPAFIVSGGTGGPIDSTLFYSVYLYQEAFGYFRMGYAAAMAWVLLVVIGLFTALQFMSARLWVHYEE